MVIHRHSRLFRCLTALVSKSGGLKKLRTEPVSVWRHCVFEPEAEVAPLARSGRMGAGCRRIVEDRQGLLRGPDRHSIRVATSAARFSERPGNMTKVALDAADLRILSAVQKHGQLSKTRLAEIVNLSPTPCWARLSRLKEAGFIRGYHADIALDRVADVTQVVVTVALTHHRKSDFDRFESFIRNLDEVTECVATGGGMDYVMKVTSPSLPAFQTLMESLLAAELGIDRYMTYIATRIVKSGHPDLARLASKDRR